MRLLQNFLVSESLVNRLPLFLDRRVGLIGSLERLSAEFCLLLAFGLFAILNCLDGLKLVLHGGIEGESFCIGSFFDNSHNLLDFLAFEDFIGGEGSFDFFEFEEVLDLLFEIVPFGFDARLLRFFGDFPLEDNLVTVLDNQITNLLRGSLLSRESIFVLLLSNTALGFGLCSFQSGSGCCLLLNDLQLCSFLELSNNHFVMLLCFLINDRIRGLAGFHCLLSSNLLVVNSLNQLR
jgi:hypothetical protein